MHVAFVIDNLGSGGAQRQAVEVAVRLKRDAGIRVSFSVYRRIDFFLPRLAEAGIEVTRLPKRGPFDPTFPRRLRAWVAATAPTVVHAFLPAPTLWAAAARRGSRSHGPIWIAGERSNPDQNVGRAVALGLRWAFRRFDAVTANSHPAADALVARFGVPAEKVHYLPNGIDLADWDRRAARPAPWPLDPGRFHLALVGRLSEEKNHRLLLAALAKLAPEARARICAWFIGAEDGPRQFLDAVALEIGELGLADVVRMVPPTPELPAFLARIDALVLPSRYEGFPNVALEAMASRLPVLALAVGDVPFMIEDGREGRVLPRGDADALAAGLRELLEMTSERRAAMGAAARAKVEAHYRIEAVAQQHLDLYRRLADSLRDDAGARALG